MRAISERHLVIMLLLVGFAFFAGDAAGQQASRTVKEQLVGTWTLVSMYSVRQDGSAFDLMGPNPVGQIMYDANGRMSVHIIRSDRPRFAAEDRLKGTPEENKAVVHGTIAYFGKYTVNEADRTVTHHIESHIFPNWNGTDQKRIFTLTGDEFKLSTPPIPLAGGLVANHMVWKRAR